MLNTKIIGENIVCDFDDDANKIYSKSTIGLVENKKYFLSLIEALYLLESEKITITNSRKKQFCFEEFLIFCEKKEKDFWMRYCVFRDLRNRGYTVKTALKFGADFRVYDRGIKPGDDHAKWIAYPVSENTKFSWYDFAAKTRVANSTKKRLLIALVDKESDVTYYEIAWKRP